MKQGQKVTVKGVAGVYTFDHYVVEFDDPDAIPPAKLSNGRIVELKDLSEYRPRESCLWMH